MTKTEYKSKKQAWAEKQSALNKGEDKELADKISKRLYTLGNLADMLDTCTTEIEELTKGTPFQLRREVKQAYNDMAHKVKLFRHLTFDIFTSININVLDEYGIKADEADVTEANDQAYKVLLALCDKLGYTLWDDKKYLALLNYIYSIKDSKTYEVK